MDDHHDYHDCWQNNLDYDDDHRHHCGQNNHHHQNHHDNHDCQQNHLDDHHDCQQTYLDHCDYHDHHDHHVGRIILMIIITNKVPMLRQTCQKLPLIISHVTLIMMIR